MATYRPFDETERVRLLTAYRILDTEPEERFDDLAFLASFICETPVAMINLIDVDRQWTKSAIGTNVRQIKRALSFCDHTIRQTDLLVVEDTTQDVRFSSNPLVVSPDTHVRFYAGSPFFTPEGLPLGTICVLDRKPRRLTPSQLNALRALSRQVRDQLELRKNLVELREALETRDRLTNMAEREQSYTRLILDTSKDGILIEDDEKVIYMNLSYSRLFGYEDPSQVIGKSIDDLAAPEDVERLKAYGRQRQRGEPAPTQYEFKIRRQDGSQLDLEASVSNFDWGDRHHIITFARDISERKRHHEERERLISELKDALANVKTLRGLLPICASCKKIRDDRGYWQLIESYVSTHTDADFTHGICPDCAKRLYPDDVE